LKKYKESIAHYEKAIQLGAKDPVLRYNLAGTYEKTGMRKKAIATYEKIASPTKEILSGLADLHLKEKNYQKTIGIYQRLAKLEPKKAGAYANLGYAYAVSGNYDLAIKNYQMALKFDSDDADIYDNLGEAYEKKGLYPKALETYKKAYALNPDSAKAAQRIPRLNIKLLQEKTQQKAGREE
jgi:tetratricopeptide (TPR) repeat protein